MHPDKKKKPWTKKDFEKSEARVREIREKYEMEQREKRANRPFVCANGFMRDED